MAKRYKTRKSAAKSSKRIPAKQPLTKDPESILAITKTCLTPAENYEIEKYTIEEKSDICYRVNLHGELGTILAGIKKADKGYSFKLSGYPFYRIVYTISGQATLKDEQGEHIINAGTVYYFAPYEKGIVANASDMPWQHIYIHFTGTKAAHLFDKITAVSNHILQVSNPETMQHLFEYLVHTCIEQYEDSQAVCDSLLQAILVSLPEAASHKLKHINVSQQNYIQCRNYIRDNFSDIVSILDIAQSCHIDKAYLCRLFKKYSNSSPMAYVTRLKMNKAALFLLQTDYSIKKVSIMLKFDNQYYFSRVFKSIYGVPPKEYRQNHQQ